MHKPAGEIHIVQKQWLNQADYTDIQALQTLCERTEPISLKLELDYKLADAQNRREDGNSRDANEFLYFLDGALIGYLGICGFGGEAGPLELTGMVHPRQRRKGIFRTLSGCAIAECRRRNTSLVLGLCDRKSEAGQALITLLKAPLHHSEYEMTLRKDIVKPEQARLQGVTLQKAKNTDVGEIDRQNRIYFGDEFGGSGEQNERVLIPEDEEKRGFTTYLAVRDGKTIGKVNLQLHKGHGGIYGLGVLPEERGRGYGRAILLLAVETLKAAEAKNIFLQVLTDNAKALNLYKSCGFETRSAMDYYRL